MNELIEVLKRIAEALESSVAVSSPCSQDETRSMCQRQSQRSQADATIDAIEAVQNNPAGSVDDDWQTIDTLISAYRAKDTASV